MEDLLKLKDAQIEALQNKLKEANVLLEDLKKVLELNNFEVINPEIVK